MGWIDLYTAEQARRIRVVLEKKASPHTSLTPAQASRAERSEARAVTVANARQARKDRRRARREARRKA